MTEDRTGDWTEKENLGSKSPPRVLTGGGKEDNQKKKIEEDKI